MPLNIPVGRKTKAKEAVASIFQKSKFPLSLLELQTQVLTSLPATAYSTIFRIVETFEKEGKVLRIDWRERGSRYEWADREHHHHIVCTVCGAIQDIPCHLFNFQELEVAAATGFAVSHHSIEFEGICQACRKKGQK